MAAFVDKVRKWKSAELPPGEELELACRVMMDGALVKVAAAAAIGGVLGAVAADKVVKSIPVGLLPWGVAISPN